MTLNVWTQTSNLYNSNFKQGSRLTWVKGRLKNVLKEIDRRSITGLETLLSLSKKRGLIRHSDLTDKPPSAASLIGYKICHENEIVMNRMQAWNGLFGLSNEKGLVSPDYSVLAVSSTCVPRFILLALTSCSFVAWFRKLSTGIGSGFNRLYWQDLGAVPILIPSYNEQEAIVRFLDYKCDLINRFIRKKRRLIELLKEQKRAIINQAVTRGLDPNVKLKPSGVPWVGDIPEHWETRRMQNLAKIRASGIDKHTRDEEILVKLCNYVDVYKNDRITSDMCFMIGSATASEVATFELKQGDLIVTKDSEDWHDIAVPAFVPDNLDGIVCGYHLALIRPRGEDVSGEYLFWTFLAKSINIQYQLASKGVTRFGLSLKGFKSASIPTPPITEQRAIAKFLDRKNREIQELITDTEKQIQLCQEYRERLISDAVTGKMDVRNIEIPDDLIDEPEEFFDDNVEVEDDAELMEEIYADD